MSKLSKYREQHSSKSIPLAFILSSPLVFIVFALGGSWLILNTFVYSDFPGSIELLIKPDGDLQLKIDGGQTVNEGAQLDGSH